MGLKKEMMLKSCWGRLDLPGESSQPTAGWAPSQALSGAAFLN